MTAEIKESIRTWIHERLEDVEQEGSMSLIGLVHWDGNGRDNEIFSMKAGQGKWGQADAMSEAFYNYATRHARGLIGSQQFQMGACYGQKNNPTRFLPFMLSGALQIGALPGGGLGTEAPTQVGQTSQGMRLAEIVVQGMLGQINPTFLVQARLIDRLMQNNNELSAENRELFVALRAELMRSAQAMHEMRMKELEFTRATDERRKLIRIAPALINAITGREIFPVSTEDSSLVMSLAENITDDELKILQVALAEKSPELSALITSRFAEIRKAKAIEAEELKKLAAQATGRSYEEAERDAAGEPIKELSKPEGAAPKAIAQGSAPEEAPKEPEKTNGAAPATVVEVPVASSDTTLMDDLLQAMGPKADLVFGMMQNEHPELAQRMKQRLATSKGKKE